MAHTIPVHEPRQGATDAERRLFNALRDRLDERYLVIHRPRWVGLGTPSRDGAADLLVASPDHGVLLMSVFGSGLSYDPHSDGWRSASPLAEDPILALEEASEALGNILGARAAGPQLTPTVGWALVVPNGYAGASGLGPQAPQERIIDAPGIEQLSQRVEQLFAHWEARRPARGNASGRWWWRALEELFVAPRQVRVRLQEKMVADRAEILALSERQTAILEALGRMRRLTVYGPAGTGKTVLAIAKARMLARQGYRVLLTCYNRWLGTYLREQTADEPLITAQHFHELCWQRCGCDERGVEVSGDPRVARLFFDQQLPSEMLDQASQEAPPFDALVVDEAQDFLSSWWAVLDAVVTDGARGIRYLFYDDRQCLRDRAPSVPGADEALQLLTNWRNTREIHREMGRFEPRMVDTPCAAPAGVPVQYERVGDDLGATLRRILTRLVRTEGVPPEDIVILTGRSAKTSAVAALPQPVGPVMIGEPGDEGVVPLAGIRAYKGLESPVVILTELSESRLAQALFYVGASRAMNHLIVLDDAWPSGASS